MPPVRKKRRKALEKHKKEKRKKVIYFERWIRIDCPNCKKQVALLDCEIPDTVFCDMCLNTFKVNDYVLKERRQR